ncbi:MAG: flavin reductase [Ferruginibacter sp.]|nr:flavin reductase [Ferruginibacter sp.]
MQTISSTDIDGMERFYRANLVNSLTGFKSVSLIGTANAAGKTNLGIFSSIVHIGSNPALVGYINRPIKAAPHTLANIEATGTYTINHIHPEFLPQAQQTSAKYDESISEFEAVGLTPQYLEDIAAPFVLESKVKYALTLQQIIPISLNDTFLVIGKITSIHLEKNILNQDGFLNLDQVPSLSCNGTGTYYLANAIADLPYAKPNQ